MHPLEVGSRLAEPAEGRVSRGGFRVLRAGLVGYGEALVLQERLLDQRRCRGEDVLILLRHPPVITLGRGADPGHVLIDPAALAERGVEIFQTGRGGDVTWHGPAQLVGYPIVDLEIVGRDLHRYLRALEDVLIRTLDSFGIAAKRLEGRTGVWVGAEKIASIGVAVRRWIAWHGFALNVGADLSGFAAIVPCGLHGVTPTSVERLLGRAPAVGEIEDEIIRRFGEVFASSCFGDYQ